MRKILRDGQQGANGNATIFASRRQFAFDGRVLIYAESLARCADKNLDCLDGGSRIYMEPGSDRSSSISSSADA
jgi:hypothetical protein